MVNFFYTNLLWSEGLGIVGILAFTALVGHVRYRPLKYLSVVFFIFCLFFFRNPERVCIEALYDDRVLICPADGEVVAVDSGDFPGGYRNRVAIFLSISDVHVNWMPVAGSIENVVYSPGEFHIASLPKSSQLNERNDTIVVTPEGDRILVRQIAGTIARTIRWWIQPGDVVDAGQKFGMIKFGSRVELFLPEDVTINVREGDCVFGGQTALGRLS